MLMTFTVGGVAVELVVEFEASGGFEPATWDHPGAEPVVEVTAVRLADPDDVLDLLGPGALRRIEAAVADALRRGEVDDWEPMAA